MNNPAQGYYQELVSKSDPRTIAQELLGDHITGECGDEIQADCPHHASSSKTSLSIHRHSGLWHCFGCDVGGNLIQFVEWVQTGQISKGTGVGKYTSHREARDWLAERAGMPKLATLSLSKDELKEVERLQEKRAIRGAVLDHLVKICHQALLSEPEVLAWISKKYGFKQDTLEQFSIGWMPSNLDLFVNHLIDSGHSQNHLLMSGAFYLDNFGQVTSMNLGRVIFPILQNGCVVDLLCRKTEWTPGPDKTKYRRLPRIKSKFDIKERLPMFGEGALRSKSKQIVLAEGIPDAIAATQAGYRAIALGTTPGPANLEFIAQQLGKTKTGVFVPDQEISHVGIRAALKQAKAIEELGSTCTIASIPLGSKQVEAEEELSKLLGSDQLHSLRGAGSKEWTRVVERKFPNDTITAENIKRLQCATKMDLCEWLRDASNPNEVSALIRNAPTRIQFEIARVKSLGDAHSKDEAVEILIPQIARQSAAKRERYITDLAEATGLTKGTLQAGIKDAVTELRKAAKFESRKASLRKKIVNKSAQGVFHLTDSGNAERMVHHFGPEIRYCRPWSKWIKWDGKRWVVDASDQVLLLAKDTARIIIKDGLAASDAEDEIELHKFSRTSESAKRRHAIVDLAARENGVQVCPEHLDRKAYHLNLINGTLDLKTGALSKHDPKDFITKLAPTSYKKDAPAPVWRKFLEQMLPDRALRDLVQRAVGSSMTGDVSGQVLFLCHGDGANGKSTFLNVMLKVLGSDYAIQAAPELFLAKPTGSHPTELTALAGVRFAACTELGSGKKFDEVLIKQLTGGDPIRARRMYENTWQFEPTHHIWISSNQKPNLAHADPAFARRIVLIPFKVSIPPAKRNHKLLEQLMQEAEGILAWAVEGCQAWLQQGLNPPPLGTGTDNDTDDGIDPIQKFLAAKTKPWKTGDPCFKAKDLYAAYCQWCSEQKVVPVMKNTFGRQLNGLGIPSEKSNGNMVYKSLADPTGRGGIGPISSTLTQRRKKKVDSNEEGICKKECNREASFPENCSTDSPTDRRLAGPEAEVEA
ncbi:MAG: hypothetical protein HQ519_10625 [Planctomycetes bacterium]|nr:hypothetical protein [Planctomycetota bacterium]